MIRLMAQTTLRVASAKPIGKNYRIYGRLTVNDTTPIIVLLYH